MSAIYENRSYSFLTFRDPTLVPVSQRTYLDNLNCQMRECEEFRFQAQRLNLNSQKCLTIIKKIDRDNYQMSLKENESALTCYVQATEQKLVQLAAEMFSLFPSEPPSAHSSKPASPGQTHRSCLKSAHSSPNSTQRRVSFSLPQQITLESDILPIHQTQEPPHVRPDFEPTAPGVEIERPVPHAPFSSWTYSVAVSKTPVPRSSCSWLCCCLKDDT